MRKVSFYTNKAYLFIIQPGLHESEIIGVRINHPGPIEHTTMPTWMVHTWLHEDMKAYRVPDDNIVRKILNPNPS